jgi:dipeptidyl aminopeptidase/acylaminoacyl peptidase
MDIRRLGVASALLAMAVTSPAVAEPVTVDLLLGLETYGRVAIDPSGTVAVFEERRARGDLPRYDLHSEGAIRYARLYRWDVGAGGVPRPLIDMAEDAGYTLGPFSPDGERLVLYRLQGDQWRLGVLDLTTEHVLWTDLSPETGAWGRSVEWLPDASLAVIAMPDGALPSRLARNSRVQGRLPGLWSAMAAGEAAYVSDGVEPQGGDPGAWRTLWRVDARTGRSEPLSAGSFLDMEASPDGRSIALLLEGAALPPPQPDQATEVRTARSLRMIDVQTGRTFDPPEATDISTSLLAWSGDSGALLVQTLAPQGRLLSINPSGATVDVTPEGVTPLAPTDVFGMPTARAGWLGGRPLLLGERDGTRGWFVADREDLRALPGLTADARLVAQGDEAALFIDDGTLLRVRDDLTIERIGAAASTARPDGPLGVRAQAGPMKASTAIWRKADGHLCRIAADPGVPSPCVEAEPGAAVSWSRGVSLGRSEAAPRELRADGPGDARVVHRLNPELDTIDLPQARLIETPGGARGWLYLPLESGPNPPPVVAIPYPGAVNPTPPSRMRLGSQSLALQGHLLVAAGYAVVFPDLPETPDPAEGLADRILAVVDAAAADGLVDGGRVGVWGWSFGGWAAVMSAAQSPRFAAVVSLDGPMNHPSAIGEMQAVARVEGQLGLSVLSNARWLETGQAGMRSTYWHDPERYRRNSPFEHADRITAPVLLVTGDLDFGLGQSEQMYGALKRLNRPVALTILFGEEHSVDSPGNVRVYYRQVLEWFDRHLRSADAPDGIASAAPTPPSGPG